MEGNVPQMNNGVAIVSLDVPRDKLHAELLTVEPESPDPATVQSNWSASVNTSIASAEVEIENGS